MKRKVIQIAGSTQLVSLPRKWAIQNNIQKGEELEITPFDTSFLVESTTKIKSKKTLSLDGRINYISYILHGLYQKGYEEVTLTYKDDLISQKIQRIIREEMIGFEIVEQNKNSLKIHSIAGGISSETETIFKRAFSLMSSMAEGILAVMNENDLSGIENLIFMQSSISKYSGFCKRITNRKMICLKDSTYFYANVIRMKEISEELKYFCYELKRVLKKDNKISSLTIKHFSEIKNMLALAGEIHSTYDEGKCFKIFDLRKKLVKEIFDNMAKFNSQELRLNHYSLNLMQKIFVFVRGRMEMDL